MTLMSVFGEIRQKLHGISAVNTRKIHFISKTSTK